MIYIATEKKYFPDSRREKTQSECNSTARSDKHRQEYDPATITLKN